VGNFGEISAAITYWFTRFLRDIETIPIRNVAFVEMGHSNFGEIFNLKVDIPGIQIVNFQKEKVTVLASGFEQQGSSQLDDQLFLQFAEEFKVNSQLEFST
jgi:hypothetical protein